MNAAKPAARTAKGRGRIARSRRRRLTPRPGGPVGLVEREVTLPVVGTVTGRDLVVAGAVVGLSVLAASWLDGDGGADAPADRSERETHARAVGYARGYEAGKRAKVARGGRP